jgi:hypothetical protein
LGKTLPSVVSLVFNWVRGYHPIRNLFFQRGGKLSESHDGMARSYGKDLTLHETPPISQNSLEDQR